MSSSTRRSSGARRSARGGAARNAEKSHERQLSLRVCVPVWYRYRKLDFPIPGLALLGSGFADSEKHPPEVPLALLHEHRTDYAGVLAVFSCTMKVSVYSHHDVTSPTPRATHRSSLCAAFTAR